MPPNLPAHTTPNQLTHTTPDHRCLDVRYDAFSMGCARIVLVLTGLPYRMSPLAGYNRTRPDKQVRTLLTPRRSMWMYNAIEIYQ